jgi:crossover junction endodeoxyribonuclease RuvC
VTGQRPAFFLLKAALRGHTVAVGITLRQFKQMTDRLGGVRARVPEPVLETTPPATSTTRVILGIDPSLRGTGYGVIRFGRGHPCAVAFGTIACPASWPRSRCLLRIADSLRAVVREHAPGVCVVEALFYAQNLQTAMILGEARGAALTVAAEAGLDIYEIAPRKVKQAIVGYGAAQKLAVAKMVQRLLNLPALPEPDAADALALALAHAQEQSRHRLTPARRI